MEALILSIQVIHSVSQAKTTFTTSRAAYCRKETGENNKGKICPIKLTSQ